MFAPLLGSDWPVHSGALSSLTLSESQDLDLRVSCLGLRAVQMSLMVARSCQALLAELGQPKSKLGLHPQSDSKFLECLLKSKFY